MKFVLAVMVEMHVIICLYQEDRCPNISLEKLCFTSVVVDIKPTFFQIFLISATYLMADI